MTPRVMIAEDDSDLRAAMAALLRDEEIDVVAVPDGTVACRYLDDCIVHDRPRLRIHALVTDLAMPEMSGARLLDYLDELGHALPTIVVTGLDSEVVDRMARRPAVRAVLRKPLDADALLRVLKTALLPIEAQGRWK